MHHRRSGSIMGFVAAAAAAGILAAVAFALAAPHGTQNNEASSSNSSANLAMATFNSTVGGSYHYPFNETSSPERLIIPSIHVNAQVQPVGMAADGLMAVTRSFWTVGWYKDGPVPGASGSAVIEGHLDQVTSPYAVFFNLDQLKPGDTVQVVDASGRTVDFSVTKTVVEPYSAPTDDIFHGGAPGESRLVLITCTGTWIQSEHQYDRRLVVFTTRVN